MRVNGLPGYCQYRRSAEGDGHDAWAVQVLELREGKIVGFTSFLDVASWFPLFGLPLRLEEGEPDPVPAPRLPEVRPRSLLADPADEIAE